MFRLPQRTTLLTVAVLGVAGVCYALAWRSAPILVNDSPGYLDLAEDLRDGRVDDLHTRPPGYPLFLLLFGAVEDPPPRSLFLAQLVLHLASLFLIVRVLGRLSVPGRLQAVFLVLGLLPPSVVLTAYVISEPLTQFMLVAGFALLLAGLDDRRPALVVGSAFLFAVSGLVRPTYSLVFVLFVGVFVASLVLAPELRRPLLLAAVAVFVLSTVIPRVFLGSDRDERYGRVHLLAGGLSSKTALYIDKLPASVGRVRSTLVMYRNRARVFDSNPRYPWHHRTQNRLYYMWRSRPVLQEITGLDGVELSRYLIQLNLGLIKRQPRSYLESVAVAVPTYWLSVTTAVSDFGSGGLRFTWELLQVGVAILFAFFSSLLLGHAAFATTLRRVSRERLAAALGPKAGLFVVAALVAIGLVIYTMAISIAVNVGNPRHRGPTDPFVFLVIVLGVHLWVRLRTAMAGDRSDPGVPEEPAAETASASPIAAD